MPQEKVSAYGIVDSVPTDNARTFKVKDMVDKAIRRAGSARLGRRISKRHADADGRILLYEKDFEL